MVWKDGIRGTEGLTHLAFWLILPSVHAEAGPGSATGPYEVLKAFCGPGRPRRPLIFVSELLCPVPAAYLTFFFQHMSLK